MCTRKVSKVVADTVFHPHQLPLRSKLGHRYFNNFIYHQAAWSKPNFCSIFILKILDSQNRRYHNNWLQVRHDFFKNHKTVTMIFEIQITVYDAEAYVNFK